MDNAARAQTTGAIDPSGDRVQPGPTILIGERNTVVHLLDVGSRVKPIGVLTPSAGAKREVRRWWISPSPKLPSQRSPRDRAGQRHLSSRPVSTSIRPFGRGSPWINAGALSGDSGCDRASRAERDHRLEFLGNDRCLDALPGISRLSGGGERQDDHVKGSPFLAHP